MAFYHAVKIVKCEPTYLSVCVIHEQLNLAASYDTMLRYDKSQVWASTE